MKNGFLVFLVVLVSLNIYAQKGNFISTDGEILIDHYDNQDIIWSSFSSEKIVVQAKYFQFERKMKPHTAIKTVVINTNSEIDGATMKLHFYEVKSDGSPGIEICTPQLFSCKAGRNNTEIDVAARKIKIAENGIFIGFERLYTDGNKRVITKTKLGAHTVTDSIISGKEQITVEQYMPSTGVLLSNKKNHWNFDGKTWSPLDKDRKQFIIGANANPAFNKYQTLAVSLILE